MLFYTIIITVTVFVCPLNAKPFELHEIGGDVKFVEIEAIHIIDSYLGLQIVHAVVPLSTYSVENALKSNSVWYIPEQEKLPKLGYLTSHGWFFLNESQIHRVQKRAYAKKAPKNAQLDVTSLLRLAPSSLENVQFIKKGSLGAYVYSPVETEGEAPKIEKGVEEKSIQTDAQLIKSGNMGAYIFSEHHLENRGEESEKDGEEKLFWIVPAIGRNQKSYTTRLHDSSLLLYYGMPRLIKLKL